MHIVDVCAFYTPLGGGVKTYVERKLRAGQEAGHRITIVAPGRTPGVRDMGRGCAILTIAGRRLLLDSRYSYFHDEPALHATLDALKPDFVEASSPWASAAMVARWPGDIPRGLVMHADPLATYAYRWLEPIFGRRLVDKGCVSFWNHLRRLDSGFDVVVSASRDLAGRLSDGGLRRVATVPMGVEPGVFSPDFRDEDLRARLLERCGLGPEARLLLAVGRHAPEKRWRMVIDAATAAGADHPLGLVLVGDGRDKPAVVHQARQNPHILFLAPISRRDEMARVMASADALVHGCESETFCMVASEARASGLPIVVPDRGGAAEQVRPGIDRSYRAADGQSLAEAIRALCGYDAGQIAARAKAGAAAIRTMDMHFDELFGIYDGLCQTRPGRLPDFQAGLPRLPMPAGVAA